MCVPIIARVLNVDGYHARVELLDGETVPANAGLHPHVTPGQHVLMDRGLIIETIEVEQVQDMLSFYAELDRLWAGEEAPGG